MPPGPGPALDGLNAGVGLNLAERGYQPGVTVRCQREVALTTAAGQEVRTVFNLSIARARVAAGARPPLSRSRFTVARLSVGSHVLDHIPTMGFWTATGFATTIGKLGEMVSTSLSSPAGS
jgi:hypothetical protein